MSDPLADARALAAAERFSGAVEYLRAALRVLIAIHDRLPAAHVETPPARTRTRKGLA